MKNLNAIVWLYRGEKEKYTTLLAEYEKAISNKVQICLDIIANLIEILPDNLTEIIKKAVDEIHFDNITGVVQ